MPAHDRTKKVLLFLKVYSAAVSYVQENIEGQKASPGDKENALLLWKRINRKNITANSIHQTKRQEILQLPVNCIFYSGAYNNQTKNNDLTFIAPAHICSLVKYGKVIPEFTNRILPVYLHSCNYLGIAGNKYENYIYKIIAPDAHFNAA